MIKTPDSRKIFFKRKLKISVFSVFLALFIIFPNPASAGTPIEVHDKLNEKVAEKSITEQTKSWFKNWDIDRVLREIGKAGDIAWRQALKYFLNTMAYDMATYLATGDKGQLPMFETQGWGGYLSNVADNTAGTMIESLGKNGPIKFNLCNPDFRI